MSIFKRLDHVSIGVKDMDKARKLFVDVLGGEPLRDLGESPGENFSWFTFMLGGKKMELVSPIKDAKDGEAPEGGVARYIENHGEGFHHISIAVDDLKEAIEFFEAKGIRVLAPNFDRDQWRHCYLHPKDTHGALIQVFEENEHTAAGAGD